MIATAEHTTALRITRLINAPRERVFAAWTTPADILKWFGPETCQVLSAKLNLRPGGDYHFPGEVGGDGRSQSGRRLSRGEAAQQTGLYLELQRPSELDFGESQVTVEFLDRKGATEIQITHEQLPNEEVKEDHNHGWNGCLDKLEKHLGVASEAQRKPMAVGEFCWNELLTSDEAGATKFYSAVFGWQTADFPARDVKYTIWKQQGKGLAA